MTPLIITVAGVGAELTRRHTPFVPLTPTEIAREARSVFDVGARVFHLHVRNASGKPTCDPRTLRKALSLIRQQAPEMIVQVSTGGAVSDTARDRLGTLLRGFDMASLTLGSINFGDEIFCNPVPLIIKLASKMKKLGIRPELEIFDAAMLEFSLYLIQQGLIDVPPHYDFVMGGRGFLSATEKNLDFLISKLPRGATFSVAGLAAFELPLAEMAIARGGHVRVGLEDNIYVAKGILARGNADLVKLVLPLTKKYNRKIAMPSEARCILRLVRS